MSDFYCTRTIKSAWKKHHCRVCGEAINVGETYQRITGFINDFFSIAFHPECYKFSERWDEDEWLYNDPGDYTRQQVLDAIKPEQNLKLSIP